MRTNVVKMVSMACQPCRVVGGHSAEAYGLRLMREVIIYGERLHQQVFFHECDMDLVTGSLGNNWQVHNGLGQGNWIANTPRHAPDIPR